jgi:hypothetical protein
MTNSKIAIAGCVEPCGMRIRIRQMYTRVMTAKHVTTAATVVSVRVSTQAQ